MPVFVIDEDMPRSIARALASLGHTSKDIRDCGLRGADDATVFRFAQTEGAVLISADLGFGNPLRFPCQHHGIVIARFPNEMSSAEMNRQIGASLREVNATDYAGNVIVIEPGRIRIRRA